MKCIESKGAVISRRWLVSSVVLVVVVILAAVGIEHSRAIRRDISFDAALWREPQHGWGRWRMLDDFKRMLESQRPTRAELIQLLEGRYERYPARANTLSSNQSALVYHLGQAPDRTSGSGEIHLYFDADGRYSSCDTSYDAL